MKKLLSFFISISFLMSGFIWGQTTVFSDNFSINTSATWTTSGAIGSSSWTITRSGDDWGARRNTSPEQLELTNDVGATTNGSGWIFANTLATSFTTPYDTVLNSNTGLVTWYFNIRTNRSNLAGFGSGNYGEAFIIGSTGNDVSASSPYNGYALILGNSGTPDPLRFGYFSGGLDGFTELIASNTTGLTNIGTNYYSVKITYDPSTNIWELFLRDDGSTAFTDPTTGSLTSQGTAKDNTYTDSSLDYLGAYWQGGTTANQLAFFDNVSVIISPLVATPVILVNFASLSGFSYVKDSGPSTSQSYDISGSNLDGSDVTITAPLDYEISLDDANWFASRTLTAFNGTSTAIYVRLKSGLSAGTYNGETISNAGGGATTQNVTCNGSVTAPVATLPLVEDFDYATGDLTSVSSANWTNFSGTGNFIQVTSGNLSYTDYPSSGIGNKIEIISTSSSAEDVYYQFATQSEGTKVYASFLLNLTNTTGLALNTSTTGDYFAAFLPSTSTTTFNSRVSIKLGTTADTYQIGLRANVGNTEAVWSITDLDINTTYLIVFSYEMISGTSNDVASLWINPSLTGSEPTADLTQTAETDINDVSRIAIRQGGTTTPNASIDGIRVATTWSEAPLPVELTSFTASISTNSVNLKWNTATEVNNYGFEIQRSAVSSKQSAENWDKIGFVKGNGNSNSPKNYYFVDENVNSGKYYYRLKQTDIDGKFTFSKVVEADIASPDVYNLDQNYPNPFNPITTIKYEIPKAGKVKIVIFDMLGREVQTLVNGYKEAGRYNVQFDASKLASGTYLYKIQAGNFTEVKKMILLK